MAGKPSISAVAEPLRTIAMAQEVKVYSMADSEEFMVMLVTINSSNPVLY